MPTLTLEVSEGHLAALRLLACINGEGNAEDEILSESKQFVTSLLEQIGEHEIAEALGN